MNYLPTFDSTLNTGEKIELGTIALLAGCVWMIAPALPGKIGIGKLLLWASGLLLFQSLVRDVWLLIKARRTAQRNPPQVARCMCVESTVGITGIVVGAALFVSGIGKPVMMERWSWSVAVVLVLAVGFLIKDFLLESKPWRIRRDKDHVNIVVKWRR